MKIVLLRMEAAQLNSWDPYMGRGLCFDPNSSFTKRIQVDDMKYFVHTTVYPMLNN